MAFNHLPFMRWSSKWMLIPPKKNAHYPQLQYGTKTRVDRAKKGFCCSDSEKILGGQRRQPGGHDGMGPF